MFMQNSMKFCENTEIPRLGSKFRGSRKTVDPSDKAKGCMADHDLDLLITVSCTRLVLFRCDV